jgi:hypothetical protein
MEQLSDDRILEIIFQEYGYFFGSDIIYLNETNPFTGLQKQFIIRICKNDINYLNDNISLIDPTDLSMGYEYIKIASTYTKDTRIIKLLLDHFDTDINDIGSMEDNISQDDDVGCLAYACAFNQNQCIIKYLIEEYGMDVYHGAPEYDCLFLASMHGNYQAIKYLIDHCAMNPNHMNTKGQNCFNIISIEDQLDDLMAILFLIEKTKIENLSLSEDVVFEHFKKFVPLVPDTKKLNHLLNCAVKKTTDPYDPYDPSEVFELIGSFNPLRLNGQLRDYVNFDPSAIRFNDWKKMVDSLDTLITDLNVKNTSSEPPAPLHINDYTVQIPGTEQVFEHNKIIYHGDKKTILGSMMIFNDWDENINFDHIVILEGSLDQYLINLYINGSLNDQPIIDQIDPRDIDQFIRFIDQYPTTRLSLTINELEIELIKYFDTNGIKYSQYMVGIIEKYQLKYMYIDLHNKNVVGSL